MPTDAPDDRAEPVTGPPTAPYPPDPESTQPQPPPTQPQPPDTLLWPGSDLAPWVVTGAEPVPGYRLTRLLGRGGFGEVWAADGPGGVAVAFKFIPLATNAGGIEQRALEIMKGVRHPNLLTIFGAWQRDGVLIIGMELADRTLHDPCREAQQAGSDGIPRGELLRYTAEAAKVLDFLNKPRHFPERGKPVGIQHGDVKPQNILLIGDGVKVGDYGLVRLLEETVTTHGGGMTVAYAPPEFFAGQTSRWADQYSLAVTYCELRSGKRPQLPTRSDPPTGSAVSEPDLTMLPDAERPAMKRALDPVPQRRWPNCRVFVKELAQGGRVRPEAPAAVWSAPHPSTTKRNMAGQEVVLDDLIRVGGEPVPGHKLERLLGRGGYGEVWEARTPGDTRCALKIVRSLDANHAEQELRTLDLTRDLDHDRFICVQAYWLLAADGSVISDEGIGQPGAPKASALVVATDLAAKNLLQRWQEYYDQGQAGIPIAELLAYMRQAAEAIDYLTFHEPAIVHRDIKPEHILLTRDNRVKVGGFGSAKIVEGASTAISAESVGMTLAYAAPELFRNIATRFTDQYSLALTYYRLHTGRLPFEDGLGPIQMMQAHAEGRLDFSAVGANGQAVLRRACAVDPNGRFASCVEFVEALRVALDMSPPPLSVPSAPLSRASSPAVGPAVIGGPAPRWAGGLPPAVTETTSNVPSAADRDTASGDIRSDWRSPRAGKGGTGKAVAAVVAAVILLAVAGGYAVYNSIGSADSLKTPEPMQFVPWPIAAIWLAAGIVAIVIAFAVANRISRRPGRPAVQVIPLEPVDLAVSTKVPSPPAARLLEGHADAVWCVASIPGDMAVSGGMDNTVRVWDLATGQERLCLTGHTDGVFGVAVSADGAEAVSAGLDGTLRRWDLRTGRELGVIEAGCGRLLAVALVPGRSGRALAGGDDPAVRLWDLTAGAELRRFEGHSGRITNLAVWSDGRLAASGSEDHTVRLWDVATGDSLRILTGHTAPVHAVAFAPDGQHLASAGADNTARWWDVTTGREVRRFEGHTDWVRGVAIAPDGRHVVTGSDDETVRLWEVDRTTALETDTDHVGSVLGVAFTTDGGAVLSASDDWTVRVRSLTNRGSRSSSPVIARSPPPGR